MNIPPIFDSFRSVLMRISPLASLLMAVIGIAAAVLWAAPTTAYAQQSPPHVFIGTASIDGHTVPDGSVIIAFVDGNAISKAVIDHGSYTLLVEQPAGQDFVGKIVEFTVNDVPAGETHLFELGGAHEINLNAAGGGPEPADSLQSVLECVARTIGRMPTSPQDLSDQERMRVLQACPGVMENLGALTGNQPQPAATTGGTSQIEQMERELRQIEQEINQLERETPLSIQREMEQLDREISNTERNLWDELQNELDRLEQQRFNTEQQFNQELRTSDLFSRAQIEFRYRRVLDNLERERFETERRSQVQIEQELSRLYRNREDTERQLWDDKQRRVNQLEQRRFELEDAINRMRMNEEQRQMDEQRFQQQEEMERQRIQQERDRFDQERRMNEERMQRERQLEQERFRQQEQLDRERIDQERQRLERERQLNQDRFDRGVQLQTGRNGNFQDASRDFGRNLPTRGFFTNSASGEISDIDKLLDPTSLAILGILLTLVATSLSLVKGS